MVSATEWFNQGQLIEINGYKHFVYDSQSDKPCLVILHGYPTCIYDYYQVLPYLEHHFRVIMHDHLGFGFSDKPKDYSYSLLTQTDQALALWHQLGVQSAVVLAHDYGTSIATELLARIEDSTDIGINLKQFLLCNGSMHIEMAQLRWIQKLLLNRVTGPFVARLSNKRTLARNLKQIYHDASQLTPIEIDALWTMMTHKQGRAVLHQVTQYISQRKHYWHRWIGALQNTQKSIHIIWAKEDPVAVYAMALTLQNEIQNSKLTTLFDSGHFPMMEAPERFSAAVIDAVLLE